MVLREQPYTVMSALNVEIQSLKLSRTKENIIHWIRVNRTKERISNTTYQQTSFDCPIVITECSHNVLLRTNDLRIKCGEVTFICDRKELMQWK